MKMKIGLLKKKKYLAALATLLIVGVALGYFLRPANTTDDFQATVNKFAQALQNHDEAALLKVVSPDFPSDFYKGCQDIENSGGCTEFTSPALARAEKILHSSYTSTSSERGMSLTYVFKYDPKAKPDAFSGLGSATFNGLKIGNTWLIDSVESRGAAAQ